jgi:hypothetical protein
LTLLRPTGDAQSVSLPPNTPEKSPLTMEGIRCALAAHNYRTQLTRNLKTKADKGTASQPTNTSKSAGERERSQMLKAAAFHDDDGDVVG